MKRFLILPGLFLAGAVICAQPPAAARREQVRERIADRHAPGSLKTADESTSGAEHATQPSPVGERQRTPERFARRTPPGTATPTPAHTPIAVKATPAEEPKGEATPAPTASPAARVHTPAAANATPFVAPPMNQRNERLQELRNRTDRRPTPAATETPVNASPTTMPSTKSTPAVPPRELIKERIQDRRDSRATPVPTSAMIMPHPKLTPFAQGLKTRPTPIPPPASGTPTPTPVAAHISKKEWTIKKGVIATPPPAPTPGATPVPTPPDVTPTPASFKVTRNWNPYPGWRPPSEWKPPSGWVPPGGWCPPPGWNPPAEWVPRLQKWGWSYIAGRGWVVDVRWVPPPDFVCPPGWYYMPQQSYHDYGFYYPGHVIVARGKARPDLIVNINIGQPYRPSQPPPAIIEQAPPPPPRALPPSAPQLLTINSVADVTQALTRPRQPDAPRYDGPVLVTGAIHFDSDSFDIKPESFDTLDKIGDALLAPPLDQAIINVEGHTDSDGSDEYNQKLSENRAWSVKSYLVQKFGIDPNRLIVVGYGESAPIADNNADTGKAQNRRVEFENVTDLYSSQVVDTNGGATDQPNP